MVYQARSPLAKTCPTCRPIVHRRRARERYRRSLAPETRGMGTTCPKCGKKRDTEKYHGFSKSGRPRRVCIDCRTDQPAYRGDIIPAEWKVERVLSRMDARMQEAGGSSLCYVCKHLEGCRQLVRTTAPVMCERSAA